jgi:hypothetical protein
MTPGQPVEPGWPLRCENHVNRYHVPIAINIG